MKRLRIPPFSVALTLTAALALGACDDDSTAAYERGFADGAASVRDGADGLTACQTARDTCNGSLTTCNSDLTTCQGTPATTCGAGTTMTTNMGSSECVAAAGACGSGTEFDGSVCTAPTHCSDGTMNDDETGLDCGGSCSPCTALEPRASTPVGDLYAFISPTDANDITLLATFAPGLDASINSESPRFADNTVYDIHIDNDGDAATDITLRFDFTTSVQNSDTILEATGPIDGPVSPNRNLRQSYDLTRIDADGTETTLITAANTAPWFYGDRTFPGGSYAGVTDDAVTTVNDVTAFAGPRDDPNFQDLGLYDLLGVAGSHTTAGRNALVVAVQLPITALTADGMRTADAGSAAAILGVHATTSELVSSAGGGTYAQTSRTDWPDIDALFLPFAERANYASGVPEDDASLLDHILFPEMRGLLVTVLGLSCPATPTEGRSDLIGLLSPNATTASTLLRINVATGQTSGDTAFPNGRALADDTLDTLLTVICNAGTPIGDGVSANDVPPLVQMPYVGAPH